MSDVSDVRKTCQTYMRWWGSPEVIPPMTWDDWFMELLRLKPQTRNCITTSQGAIQLLMVMSHAPTLGAARFWSPTELWRRPVIANAVKPLGNLALVPIGIKAATDFPWRFGGPTSIKPAKLTSSKWGFATSAVILVVNHEC